MKCGVLILIMMFTVSKHVSASAIPWSEGTVVLQNEMVIRGELSVNDRHNVILLKQGGRIEVLGAHCIRSVHYYDQRQDINRRFISMELKRGYGGWHLYEVVLTGEVSILRKMKSIAGQSVSDKNDYTYFVCHDNVLVNIRSFRKIVYPKLVSVAGAQLTSYVKSNQLNPNLDANALVIAEHYNRITKTDFITVRD